jgi:hypothetical protein
LIPAKLTLFGGTSLQEGGDRIFVAAEDDEVLAKRVVLALVLEVQEPEVAGGEEKTSVAAEVEGAI